MKEITRSFFRNILTLWGFQIIAGIASILFYVSMAHFLSVEDYGLFYTLVSLFYLFTIPQETIRTIVARSCAKTEDNSKIRYLFSKYLKITFFFGVGLLLIFLLAIPYLKAFFKTSFFPLFIIGSSSIFAFILPVIWGVMQGTFRFKELGINNVIELLSKLGIALLLVSLLPGEKKIFGALIAIPLSLVCAFFSGFFPLKDLMKGKKEKVRERNILKYALASLALFSLIGVLCSIDVLLARYFFKERIAGFYAGISMIAKALFFIAMNAKRVMLPTITKERIKNPRKILKKTALIISMLFGSFFILSLIFPEIIITSFLGKKYLEVAPLLKYSVLVFALFSLSTLLVFYNLSLDKNKKITLRILMAGTFMLTALLILFHETLMQFILMQLIVHITMFVFLLIVSLRE